MIRLLSVLALSSALLLSAGIARGRDLPWRTFADANQALAGFTIGTCSDGPVYVSFYRVGGEAYVFLSADRPGPGPNPLVVLYDPDPNGPNPATEYGAGEWSARGGDEIPPLRWAPMTPQFDVCTILYPVVTPI